MARDEEITYGSYVIGGASGPAPIERFEWASDGRTARFDVDFVVTVSSYPNLATAAQAAEAALTLRRQRLTVKFGASTLLDYDPATGAQGSTGFNARARLRKLRDRATGAGRRYRFEVEVDLPQADQGGRLEERWTLHKDLEERRIVTLEGVYRQLTTNTAYAQYVAAIGAHATEVLNLVDSGATWVLAEEEATPNDANTECSYRRVYWECPSGRRSSRTTVTYGPARTRTVVISGVYVKTGATSADANYQANEDTHSGAVLTALGIGSTSRELVHETKEPNEQDETLTFRREYRELIHQQAAGTNDDPEVVFDEIRLSRGRPSADSSPAPRAIGAGGAGGVPGGKAGGRAADQGGEIEEVSEGSGTPARPLLDITVDYSAWIKNTNTALWQKWNGTLRGHLVQLITSKLGLVASCVMREDVRCDIVQNRIDAQLRLRATDANLISLTVQDSYADDFGVRTTGVLTGEQHDYLVQQGFAKRRRTRQTDVLFVKGTVSPTSYFTRQDPNTKTGWLLVGRSVPRVKDTVLGGSDAGQLPVTAVTIVEEFVFVRSAIRGSVTGTQSREPGGRPGRVT